MTSAPDAGGDIDAGSVDAGADAGSCVPSLELCNGRDDDCDGFIDNMAMVSARDAGVIDLDGGVALANGMCTFGIGACANSGMTSCVSGALSCSAIPAMPGVERCNNLDDDCDGMTDENEPGICTVTGQLCSGGACACPSGQSVCSGMCKVLTAEVCDGLDNDCNGQIDCAARQLMSV